MLTFEQASRLTYGDRIYELFNKNHTRTYSVRKVHVYKRQPKVRVYFVRAGSILIARGEDNWYYTHNPYRVPTPRNSSYHKG